MVIERTRVIHTVDYTKYTHPSATALFPSSCVVIDMSAPVALPGGKRGALALKYWIDQAHLVHVPIHDAVKGKEVTHFALRIHEVVNIKIPSSVLRSKAKTDRLGVRVNLTFYGAKAKAFFGTTHEGPIKYVRVEDVRDPIVVDEFMYFSSPVNDPDCYGVIEIQFVHENSSTGIKRAYAAGWSTFRCFSKTKDLMDVGDEDADDDEEMEDIVLYQGSPRALLTMAPEEVRKKKGWKQFRGRQVSYTLRSYNRLERIAHLFKIHDIIGMNDRLGGLEPVDVNGKEGPFLINPRYPNQPAVPSLAMKMEIDVKDIVVRIPKLIDEGIEKALRGVGFAKQDGTRVARTLRIGLHNGHTTISPQFKGRDRGAWKDGWNHVELSHSRGENHRAAGFAIPHYVRDSSVAVVVELLYSIGGGSDAVVATAILVPFDGSKYLEGISSTTSKKKSGTMLKVPMVRGAIVSPNGFTGGVGGSDGVNGGSMPLLSIAMEVEEPDDLQAEARRKAKEKSKLRRQHEARLEEDESEIARRKKLEAVSVKKKKTGKDVAQVKKKRGARADSSDDEDGIFDKPHRGKKSSTRYSEYEGIQEKENEALQTKSSVLGGEAVVSGLPRGSNDMLMRSLLAQSLKQPIRKAGIDGVREVSAVGGAYYPGATAVIGGTTPLATELTRASKTFLSRNGFTDVLSDSVSGGASVKRIPLPSRRNVDLDVELSDPLTGHEITFQFAAFRTAEGLNIPQPRTVYFTFQFFNNLPTRTERMVLASGGDAFLNARAPGSLSMPRVLIREDRHGRNIPSLAIKYHIDTSTIPGETRDFAEYLGMKTLFIEVWDGDSLHQIGTVAVELQQLLRQGDPVVKSALEYDVISSSIEGDSTSALPIIQARSLPAGRVAGRVQLLVSNYGLPGSGPYSEVGASSAAMDGRVEPGKEFLSKSVGDRDWRVGARTGIDNLSKGSINAAARHSARAVPLASTQPELKSLLTSRVGKSYDGGYKRTSRAARKKDRAEWGGHEDNDVRALSDPFSLSPNELDTLFSHCSGAHGKIRWDKFVEDILGAKVERKARGGGGEKLGILGKLERRMHKILNKAQDSGLNFEEMFAEFDVNGNGRIGHTEFEKALEKLGFHASKKDMQLLMLKFDENEDGNITLDEFVKFAKAKSPSLRSNAIEKAEKRLRKIVVKAEEKGMTVRDMFSHFDKNDNGEVSKGEWIDALSELGISVTKTEARTIMAHLDGDDSGSLNVDEFVQFVEGLPKTTGTGSKIFQMEVRLHEILQKAVDKGMSIRKTFAHFDEDGRGSVNDRDFEEALEKLGFRATGSELTELVKKFDVDGDGYVSIKEFVRWSKSTPKESSPGAPARLGDALSKCRKCYDKAKSDGRDINAMFGSFDRGTGVVSRTEFRYVLMEMGLSLQDERVDGKDDDVRASTIRRQVDRLEQWRQRRGGDNKRSSRASEVVGKEHANEDLFARHSEDLEVVRRYREGRKKALVSRLLRSNISNEVSIHPSFGRTLFFEFPLTNPYSHEERFSIECADPELRVVLDTAAWRHYRRVLQPAAGQLGDKVEDEMLDSELQLTLAPQETVYVPFMFLSFASGSVSLDHRKATTKRVAERTDEGKVNEGKSGDNESKSSRDDDEEFAGVHGNRGAGITIRRRTVPISFKSAHHGHTVSLLQVHIRPRPFCVDRTFHFHQGENQFLKRCIAIHPRNFNVYGAAPAMMPNVNDVTHKSSQGAVNPEASASTMPAKFIHCPSNDVVVEWRDQLDPNKPQEIFIRYRCGSFPAIGQFFIIVYADQYHAVIDEIWHVSVQSMLRVDINGFVGQGTPAELMVKGDNYSRRVKCFSTHPGETKFNPNVPFQLVPGAYNKVELMSRPLRVGNNRMLVNMVDLDTHELVAAWLATVTASAPIVTKTYEVGIPVGGSAHKKIAYVNQWDRNRNFELRTSDPNVMKCKEPKLSVRKHGKAFIRLFFQPVHVPGIREFFVFVNDDEDQNEECLLIKVHFS
jgi:Ca2+-binding EF-hand superfamily protein